MFGGRATGCTRDQEAEDAPGETVGDRKSAETGRGDAENDAGRTMCVCGLWGGVAGGTGAEAISWPDSSRSTKNGRVSGRDGGGGGGKAAESCEGTGAEVGTAGDGPMPEALGVISAMATESCTNKRENAARHETTNKPQERMHARSTFYRNRGAVGYAAVPVPAAGRQN